MLLEECRAAWETGGKVLLAVVRGMEVQYPVVHVIVTFAHGEGRDSRLNVCLHRYFRTGYKWDVSVDRSITLRVQPGSAGLTTDPDPNDPDKPGGESLASVYERLMEDVSRQFRMPVERGQYGLGAIPKR